MLLDYMWPMMPTTLWVSVKYRHLPVTSSITSFLLLKLVTVISTTLLVLQPTELSMHVPIQLQGTFNATAFMATLFPAGESLTINADGEITYPFGSLYNGLSDPVYANVSFNPVYAYLSLLTGQDVGNNSIEDNMVFPTVQVEAMTSNMTSVTSTVGVSESRADCEIADVKVFRCSTRLCLTLDTETCRVGYQNIRDSNGQLTNQTMITKYSSRDPYLFQRVDCGDDINRPGDAYPSPFGYLSATTPYTYRYALIATTYLDRERDFLNSTVQEFDILGTMNTSAVLCKIEYDIRPRKLIKDLLADSYIVETEEAGSPEKLPGLTDVQFSEIIVSTIYGARAIFNLEVTLDSSEVIAESMFQLMMKTLNENASVENLLDPKTMRDAATNVLTGLGAQLMSQSFIVSQITDISGKATYTENRLHVGSVPLWGMIVGFVLVSLLTLSMKFTITRDVVLHDPNSLATHATILAASPTVQELLQGCGGLRLSQIRGKIAGMRFRTTTNNSFGIETIKDSQPAHGSSKEHEREATSKKEWMPVFAQKPMIAVALSLPILAIIVLEVLYKLSVSNNGVLNVAGDDTLASYAIRYSSVVVVLILANVFSSLDFVIATFTIFSALRSGGVSARRSVLNRMNGCLPPLAFYIAVRDKHYGAALSNAASTISTVLPIIVSGLWKYNDMNIVQNAVSAFQATQWDPQWNSSSIDNGATTLFNNIQHGSATMPPTIWEDLVMPNVEDISFEANNSRDTFANASISFLLTVPALRPRLTCVLISPSQIEIGREAWTQGPISYHYVNAKVGTVVDIPPSCNQVLQEALNVIAMNESCCNTPPSANSWKGDLIDLQFRPKSGSEVRSNISNTSLPYTVDGCPSLGAMFAFYNSAMVAENVTAIICHQQIQQVITNVTYIRDSNNSLIVDETQPPLPDEDRATYLTNSDTGFASFTYNIIQHLTDNLTLFEQPSSPKYENVLGSGYAQYFDPFFNHLIYGPNGTTVDALNGPQNTKQFIEAVDTLYRKYMVHVINSNFRDVKPSSTPFPSDNTRQSSPINPIVYGTATGPIKPRLCIVPGPKLTLQILLGVMSVLGSAAYVLVDLRGTLPRNLCSIASTMALLAGSEMCARGYTTEDTAEDAKDLVQRWEEQVFSLGWWNSGEGAAREERFGIDVGVANRLGFRGRRGWRMDWR